MSRPLGIALLVLLWLASHIAFAATRSPVDRLHDWLHSFGSFTLLDPNTWPFIPIPEVATDPNGGTTYGLIPTVLFHDSTGHISGILAPEINNNPTLGPGATFRYLAYPSADVQWYVYAGFQHTIARRVDLDYSTGRTRRNWWSADLRLFWERDPTERFFGIGNESQNQDQTNYTLEQFFVRATVGVNLTPQFQIAYTLKPRYVRIGAGAFDQPFIGDLFPRVKGLNGGTEIINMLTATYDTRDSVDLPSSGGLALLYGAVADRRIGSSISYTRFGGEFRRYIRLGNRVVIAVHGFLEFTPAGNELPFWAMARLGGEPSLLTDQQTLRGYGAGRFVDNNLEDLNIEARVKVFEATIFKTHGILQLAPFFDAGRVSHELTDNPINRFHPAGGLGFRAVADPFIVGYVDVGYASEGFAVFSGVNYPF